MQTYCERRCKGNATSFVLRKEKPTIQLLRTLRIALAGAAISHPSASIAQPATSQGGSLFLIEAKFADSSWAAMADKPQNRRQLLQAVVSKLGGNVENYWFSFGENDAYVVVRLPDNVSAETVQIAGYAGAGFKSLKTIPLLTVEQEMQAAAKAGELRSSAAYRAAHKGLEP